MDLNKERPDMAVGDGVEPKVPERRGIRLGHVDVHKHDPVATALILTRVFDGSARALWTKALADVGEQAFRGCLDDLKHELEAGTILNAGAALMRMVEDRKEAMAGRKPQAEDDLRY